jgi:hypothetical protein
MSITGNQPKLQFRSEWLSEQEIPSPTAVDIENRTCAMYSRKTAEKKKGQQMYRVCAETNVMHWWGMYYLTRPRTGFSERFRSLIFKKHQRERVLGRLGEGGLPTHGDAETVEELLLEENNGI